VTPLSQQPAPVQDNQPIFDPTRFKTKAPIILSPLLPPVACKLLNIPEAKLEGVKWAPLNPPMESSSWLTIKYSTSKNFTIQEYKGWAGVNYRIVARQPKSSDLVVEVALGTDLNSLKQIMDILAEIDHLYDFNYQTFWHKITASTSQ